MDEPPVTPPTRRQALVARAEQAALVVLALALLAGVAYRAAAYWRIGQPPLEVIPPPAPTYRVNVNTADWITLALAPGVGETLARRIVAAREARPGGRFTSLDQLKAVHGIGDKMLAKLRPFLSLDESGADGEPISLPEPARPAP